MSREYRYYQREADNRIAEELRTNDKCLVKMFCGTGKSLLMRQCQVAQNKPLVVFVFPSLALIKQFYEQYLQDFPPEDVLRISSEIESTTNTDRIREFLAKPTNKIICITYQSFDTLLDCLGDIRINVGIFDEAHHAVGETYQKLIFENAVCEKQIFLTATPKNANGIVMYDREHPDSGMCGRLVYDYSYLRGINEDYLNPIKIRVDMYTENTNKSVYECIARAILTTGNARVLTFHSDVNGDRDTSVKKFVNAAEFKRVFKAVQKAEFPKIKTYKNIQMIGLSSDVNSKKRDEILKQFETPDTDVVVISSCETIGEGVDTKNANMCVFVDPKTSYVKIIQNIGRVVRKLLGQAKPNSTVLIPCWVDKTKYLECGGDKEKCDEVIRQDMNKEGNFNAILNVLTALKQEDEDLYDICLNYPDTFSPQEIEGNLERNGYTIVEQVGDGTLKETVEYMGLDYDDDDDDYDEYETEKERIMAMAESNEVCIEIHTNSLDTPVERYNGECESGEVVRMYKTTDEDTGEEVYCPIVEKTTGEKRTRGIVNGPNRETRMRMNVHTNPDVKVLWNITSDIDLTKDICSCVIDCEVVKYDPMEIAQGIVERAKEREVNGGRLLPRVISNKYNRTNPELEQENKDGRKLSDWKKALKGIGNSKCCEDVRDYLDEHLPDWRTELDFDEKAMQDAEEIVKRAKEREAKGWELIPKRRLTQIFTPELEQESKDANKLKSWKQALKGNNKVSGNKCSDEVRDYLDEQLPGWRTELDEKAMEYATNIVERAKVRQSIGGRLLPRKIQNKNTRKTLELEQEYRDANKLQSWKQALKNKVSRNKCSDEVRDYLDEQLPGWRTDLVLDEKAMEDAEEIVERANIRKTNGYRLLPRGGMEKKTRTTPELEQEHKDANKLQSWKQALKGNNKVSGNKCCDEVRDYLDEQLPGWRTELDEKAMEDAEAIVERAKERKKKGGRLLPQNISKPNRTTPELNQEYRDATKLGHLKKALKGKGTSRCPDDVRDYLDQNLPGWRPIEESNTPSPPVKPKKKSMKLNASTSVPSTEPKESHEQKRQRTKSVLSELHQKYKTLTSEHLRALFHTNTNLWKEYHAISEENETTFPEADIPRNRIIHALSQIKTTRTKRVVDMGCGKAQIAKHFQHDSRFELFNYDHVACDDTVVSCDISKTPLEENSVEICILSLAMWGSNCEQYIQEAYRILESGGKLYIIEPSKRWAVKDADGNPIPGTEGERLKKEINDAGFKIIDESIEKFCMFTCIRQ